MSLIQRFILCFLLVLAYSCFLLGLFLPIIHISGRFIGAGSIDIVKSTVGSILTFYDEGFWLPLCIVVFFSIIFPILKLISMIKVLYELSYVNDSIRSLITENKISNSKAIIDKLYRLRTAAKYQLLDVFVTIFMLAFLNQDILIAELKIGFILYSLFCISSVIASELIYIFYSYRLSFNNRQEGEFSIYIPKLDKFFLTLANLTFLLGIYQAFSTPLLIVKIAFQNSIIVSQKTMSLNDILLEFTSQTSVVDYFTLFGDSQSGSPQIALSVIFLFIGGVLFPLVISLFTLMICFNRFVSGKIGQFVWFIMDLLTDWCLTDVACLALFTTLISLNAFDALRADVPSGFMNGFYFLLMAGIAQFDIVLQLRGLRYSTTNEEIPTDIQTPLTHVNNHPKVYQQIITKMSGTVLIFKAIGWGVFFIVWFTHAQSMKFSVDQINSQLAANIPLVNKSLRESLPSTVGYCSKGGYIETADIPPTPCTDQGVLFYEKTKSNEVLARWVTGLKTTRMESMYLSIPQTNKMAFTINGIIDSLSLSLFIGQCITPDNWFKKHCDKMWDNTDACCGVHRHFRIELLADCHNEYPFVRNIEVSKLNVEKITISESIAGLITISLSDVTAKVEEALANAIRPYVHNKPFVPWGGDTITLVHLINGLMELNAAGNIIQCPVPQS